MIEEPKPMQEIHQIQESLYKKDSKLSSRQRIQTLRDEAAQLVKTYRLKLKTPSKA